MSQYGITGPLQVEVGVVGKIDNSQSSSSSKVFQGHFIASITDRVGSSSCYSTRVSLLSISTSITELYTSISLCIKLPVNL